MTWMSFMDKPVRQPWEAYQGWFTIWPLRRPYAAELGIVPTLIALFDLDDRQSFKFSGG